MFYLTVMTGFHTEFKGDAIVLGSLGACSAAKIMVLEVWSLLTNFDSTNAFFIRH